MFLSMFSHLVVAQASFGKLLRQAQYESGQVLPVSWRNILAKPGLCVSGRLSHFSIILRTRNKLCYYQRARGAGVEDYIIRHPVGCLRGKSLFTLPVAVFIVPA